MKGKGELGVLKERLRKLFRRDNLIILVLSGVLLFIIALPTKEKGISGQEDGQNRGNSDFFGLDMVDGGNGQAKDATNGEMGSYADSGAGLTSSYVRGVAEDLADGTAAYKSEYSYALYLEERLEKILSGVNDVGKVSVMITLESSEELIVEKDIPQTYSDINEKDAQGGERTTSQTDREESTVYVTEGSDSKPYVVMRMLPKVEGVLVVSEGAGKSNVNKTITEMIQALFDVEAHKIKVVKMAGSN